MVLVVGHSISIHFCNRHNYSPPGQNVLKITIISIRYTTSAYRLIVILHEKIGQLTENILKDHRKCLLVHTNALFTLQQIVTRRVYGHDSRALLRSLLPGQEPLHCQLAIHNNVIWGVHGAGDGKAGKFPALFLKSEC